MAAALIAFGLTFARCPPVFAGLRQWRLLDVAGKRPSHVRPTPRGGGIALAIGASVAVAIASALGGQVNSGPQATGLTDRRDRPAGGRGRGTGTARVAPARIVRT